jgi:hypothetical protein
MLLLCASPEASRHRSAFLARHLGLRQLSCRNGEICWKNRSALNTVRYEDTEEIAEQITGWLYSTMPRMEDALSA